GLRPRREVLAVVAVLRSAAQQGEGVGDEAAESFRRHALVLEALRRDGDHVAAQSRRVALAEAAQVVVREREEEDAVRRRGQAFGELLQARRAGESGVG